MSKQLKNAKINMISGLVWAIFSCLYFGETFTFQHVEIANTVGPAFMPRVISGMIFFFSVWLCLKGLCAYRKLTKKEKIPAEISKNKGGLLRSCSTFFILLFIAVFLRSLGFILTLIPAMFALFIVIEKPRQRHYLRNILISIISPIAAYLLFYYLFSTLLPPGLLRPLLVYL